MCRAMVRVSKYLEKLPNHFLIMNIHDELCNLHKVLGIKRLMEESGNDVGIPLTVEYAFHPNNWGEEVKL